MATTLGLTPASPQPPSETEARWAGSFREYIATVDPGYRFEPHHEKLIAFLQRIADGEVTRGMIFMPPRHGKSRTTSELFPSYVLGRYPNQKVIAASYADELATEFGGEARRAMEDEAWPWPDVQPGGRGVAGAGRAAGSWRIAGHDGRYHAAGIGGGITGRGANLLLIDDPIKDQKQADSATIRENIWQWYNSVAKTRLENELVAGGRKAAVLLIMTRWHEDDLAGRLLSEAERDPNADQWEVLRFPLMAEDPHDEYRGREVGPDPLGREPGAVLWPERVSQEEAVNLQATTAPRIFAAIYQQRPTRAGGTLFKMEWMGNRYSLKVLPVYRRIIQVCDAAWKQGIENSYSVIQTWGLTDYSYDLLDQWRRRVPYTSLVLALRDNWWKWQPYGLSALYLEEAASALAAIDELLVHNTRPGTPPIVAIPYPVNGVQQFSFVETATPFFMGKRVRLPEQAPWLADWVREHVGYPTEPQDDTVVCTAMALRLLSGDSPGRSLVSLADFGKPGVKHGGSTPQLPGRTPWEPPKPGAQATFATFGRR